MAVTRGEAQDIYDLVRDVLDDWISSSRHRDSGGAGINEAALPRIRNDVVDSLRKYFSARCIRVD